MPKRPTAIFSFGNGGVIERFDDKVPVKPDNGETVGSISRSLQDETDAGSWHAFGWHLTMMNKKVLVVEDDADIRAVLRDILESDGYVVETIGHGKRVFDVIDEFVPDIVLLDIMLPDADGAEICKELRRRIPTLPVILLSAGYYQIGAVNIKNAPSDFIEKPFQIEDVLIKVRSNLLTV